VNAPSPVVAVSPPSTRGPGLTVLGVCGRGTGPGPAHLAGNLVHGRLGRDATVSQIGRASGRSAGALRRPLTGAGVAERGPRTTGQVTP
jgi:hypothetical protein